MTYYSPTDPTQQVPVTPGSSPSTPAAEPDATPSAPSGGYPTYPATPSAGYPVPAAPTPSAPPTAQYPSSPVAPYSPAAPVAPYSPAAPVAPYSPIAPYVPVGGKAGAAGTASRANLAGIIVTAGGVLLVLLGVWLPWYKQGSTTAKFADILRTAKAPGGKGLPHFYFGTGLWLVIGITVALCLLANMGYATSALRIVGPLVALAGAGLVLASLNALIDGHGGIFDHASIGLFLVLFGFVVAAVGGVLGDRPGPRTG